MVKPPFPEVVDSTLMAAARACHQRAYRAYFEHWKPKGESVHLVAGKAYASGLEAARLAYYRDGLSEETAVAMGVAQLLKDYGDFECPEDSAKSANRTAGALEFYFDRYPLANENGRPHTFPDGRLGIEFNFVQPLPVDHPVTGLPLLYTGRADMIFNFAEGLYVEDDKTTSSLGPSWNRQWDLRSQFTAYCWAAREVGIPVQGVIVRGVSILKTKYDTQQAITNRSPWEIDRWLKQTVRDIYRLIAAWHEGYFDYNLDNACTEYGGCQFREICRSNDPATWLPMYFDRKKWDPLTRTETLLGANE